MVPTPKRYEDIPLAERIMYALRDAGVMDFCGTDLAEVQENMAKGKQLIQDLVVKEFRLRSKLYIPGAPTS
jgi:hypothetical protein